MKVSKKIARPQKSRARLQPASPGAALDAELARRAPARAACIKMLEEALAAANAGNIAGLVVISTSGGEDSNRRWGGICNIHLATAVRIVERDILEVVSPMANTFKPLEG